MYLNLYLNQSKNNKIRSLIFILVYQIKRLINNKKFVIIFLYLLGPFFYLLSLKEIKTSKMKCFSKYGLECYFLLGKLIFISAILTVFFIYLITFKNYSKIHLLILLFVYLIFFFFDHNKGIVKHGFFNFLAFLFMITILFLVFCYANLLMRFFRNAKYSLLIIYLMPIILLYILFNIYKLNHFSCEDWPKGFNNTFIDNKSKDYPCKIYSTKSHSCYLKEIGPFVDFSATYRPTCLDSKLIELQYQAVLNDFSKLKYSNESKMNHFAFPLTNNKKYNPDKFGTILSSKGKKNFYKTINKDILLMDLYLKNKTKYYPDIDKPEIEIILKNKSGIIINKINKNITLIKERKQILKKNKQNLFYRNVLIFFFDTLSRAHFHRKFIKTSKFLNSFFKYESNFDRKNMTIFEYFKYHSLDSYSDPNLKALYYGTDYNKMKISFANYFRKNGFIIGRGNTFCEKECVFNNNKHKKFLHSHWDHENISLSCLKAIYHGLFLSKLYSLIKKCLFGKQLFQYILDYLESFWLTYRNQNKMFLFQSLDGHEPTGQVIGYIDDIFYNFLTKFYSNGLFKDTVILIFSDHGQHLNGPLYLTESFDFLYELVLPTLFIIIPNDSKLYKNNLYEKMRDNQQTLITAFDIHDTLIHLAFGNEKKMFKKFKSNYGNSLFNNLNYRIRFCESPKYKSKINLKVCKCNKK